MIILWIADLSLVQRSSQGPGPLWSLDVCCCQATWRVQTH